MLYGSNNVSFIEKRNREQIHQIFEQLKPIEDTVADLLSQHSLKVVDDVATNCATINKNVNDVLKLYPEIKDMGEKIEIKAILQFYYDCIDKLIDFVRHVEQFDKLHEDYYDAIVDFVEEKEDLIKIKYKPIATQELIAFYDEGKRNALESILEDKLTNKDHEFFTFGSLEQEIKKIARTAGADLVSILSAKSLKDSGLFDPLDLLEGAKSIISYAIAYSGNTLRRAELRGENESDEFLNIHFERFIAVNKELHDYIASKKYKTVSYKTLSSYSDYDRGKGEKELEILDLKRTYLADGNPITSQHQLFINSIITDAELLPDS